MSEITKISRRLRKNQTDAEKELWSYLRYNKCGVKFRRQFPILYTSDNKKKFFVADFACIEKKLIIEVDGKIHDRQKEKDDERDRIIRSLGYTVIRFKNSDIFKNPDSVLENINQYISAPSARWAPSP
jgi:very-short-patch-repair endonuclease